MIFDLDYFVIFQFHHPAGTKLVTNSVTPAAAEAAAAPDCPKSKAQYTARTVIIITPMIIICLSVLL